MSFKPKPAPKAPAAEPAPPRSAQVQFGPTPSPPGSRLKGGRKS